MLSPVQSANVNLDSNVHVANMGSIGAHQDPGGPHVGPMKFAIWETYRFLNQSWFIIHLTPGNKTVKF